MALPAPLSLLSPWLGAGFAPPALTASAVCARQTQCRPARRSGPDLILTRSHRSQA